MLKCYVVYSNTNYDLNQSKNQYCKENKVIHITMKIFLGCCENKMRFSVS